MGHLLVNSFTFCRSQNIYFALFLKCVKVDGGGFQYFRDVADLSSHTMSDVILLFLLTSIPQSAFKHFPFITKFEWFMIIICLGLIFFHFSCAWTSLSILELCVYYLHQIWKMFSTFERYFASCSLSSESPVTHIFGPWKLPYRSLLCFLFFFKFSFVCFILKHRSLIFSSAIFNLPLIPSIVFFISNNVVFNL